MTPEELASAIQGQVAAAVQAGVLPQSCMATQVSVERPKNREHGDWATNIAMVLAKSAAKPPREVAQDLTTRLLTIPEITKAEIAGPGFINITLDSAATGLIAISIIQSGSNYGKSNQLNGETINVEFISANPTGPLHLGHTRWAAVGDAMARVLAAAGGKVSREFYINDRGVQMQKFAASIHAAATGLPAPEDGYLGEYITDLANQIKAKAPNFESLTPEDQLSICLEQGYALQLAIQQESLVEFGTVFDTWYSEAKMHADNKVVHALEVLEKHGHVDRKDGAIWLRTTDFGDDKDRVLVKSDGEYTYFASDCAYYIDKRERGFDRCFYLLGADHHGYVNRLRAVAACAGDNPDKSIEVLIGQLVKIMRGDQEVKLSKRAGDLILLTDLVAEVGVDAARYSLIRYPVDTPLTLDLDLLVSRTNDNPVYYVQYAHARISALLRTASELGHDWQNGNLEFDPGLLVTESEAILLGKLAGYPRIVGSAAELREPHRVARYLEDLANSYHKFYDACRVLPAATEELTSLNVARLHVCAATRIVISNGLDLLGVSAPQRM